MYSYSKQTGSQFAGVVMQRQNDDVGLSFAATADLTGRHYKQQQRKQPSVVSTLSAESLIQPYLLTRIQHPSTLVSSVILLRSQN